jgi:hypothetical protein
LRASCRFVLISHLLFSLSLYLTAFSKGDSKTSFSNEILHLTYSHDKLSIFVLFLCLGFPSIYRLILWDPRLGHLSLSLSLSLFSYVGWRFRMENMSFDDLGLLIGVIEIRVVLHILVHGL